jgi:hypothetical protein
LTGGTESVKEGPSDDRHEASSGCGFRRRHPDMEGSCEYIE